MKTKKIHIEKRSFNTLVTVVLCVFFRIAFLNK